MNFQGANLGSAIGDDAVQENRFCPPNENFTDRVQRWTGTGKAGVIPPERCDCRPGRHVGPEPARTATAGPETEAGVASSVRAGVDAALCRVRAWRPPLNWSRNDWLEEACQISELAALQAVEHYDLAYGVPLEPFVCQRVVGAVFTQYRREWRFGMRFVAPEPISENDIAQEPQPRESFSDSSASLPDVTAYRDLWEGVRALPKSAGWLLVLIFWYGHTETEVAAALGLTQRAVCKRKHAALQSLRGWLTVGLCP
jgi:DNA-directed RNA polymerase specialized sigma24 family protein